MYVYVSLTSFKVEIGTFYNEPILKDELNALVKTTYRWQTTENNSHKQGLVANFELISLSYIRPILIGPPKVSNGTFSNQNCVAIER